MLSRLHRLLDQQKPGAFSGLRCKGGAEAVWPKNYD